MQFPTPQQFAELLHKSLLPREIKLFILDNLPNLSREKILEIYTKLQEEQEKIQKVQAELDSKIQFATLKFEQELAELKKDKE